MQRRHAHTQRFWVLVAALLALLFPITTAPLAWAKKKPDKKRKKGADDDLDDKDDIELKEDRELFIRNVVKSATKSVTTIQEAPTVINVLTAEEIENYGYRGLLMTMLSMPGILETNSQNSNFPSFTVRGVTQAVLFMKDGLSLFDPVLNTTPSPFRQPLENIKRIELTTAPGGVLWGANSFLGIANVITKDAEDVNGLEVGFGFGGIPGLCGGSKRSQWYCSPGDSSVIRPYLMYGKTFLGGKLKVFSHLSLEWFRGPVYEIQENQIYSPPPRLNGPALFSLEQQTSHTPFSIYGQFDGKISYVKPGTQRKLQLAWQLVFTQVPGLFDGGLAKPVGFVLSVPHHQDAISTIRESNVNWTNSFAYLMFKDRFWKNKIGLNTRVFYSFFDRSFNPIVIFPQSPGVLDGLAFNAKIQGHRAGWTFDMDFQIHRTFKLLVGGEAFYEWIKDATAQFIAPVDDIGQFRYDKPSIICPFNDTNGNGLPVYVPNDADQTNFVPNCRSPFIFDSDRVIFAGYLSAQYRPIKRLTLDAGVRVQAAPIGNRGYDPQLLYSGAAVLRLWDQWYLKANYATGFRAPIFNNTAGNPATVEYAGNPNIKPETSQAITVELNTKLFRNKHHIRAWDLRLDYAYTILTDRIVILSGAYENAEGDSAIHSVEFGSRLYIKGGHAFNFAYTYLISWGPNDVNGGFFRSVPNHWFAMAGIFNVLKKGRWQLDLNTTLRIIGPFEDPNRVPASSNGVAATSAMTWDRVPPSAHWSLGARLRVKVAKRPMEIKANFYNVLNGRFNNIDPNFALGPRTELLPVPLQRFAFFIQWKYRI